MASKTLLERSSRSPELELPPGGFLESGLRGRGSSRKRTFQQHQGHPQCPSSQGSTYSNDQPEFSPQKKKPEYQPEPDPLLSSTMAAPDPFDELLNKVNRLLEDPDPQSVIPGLASLAKGSPATVLNETIEPLSGLGESHTPSDDKYQTAIRKLLEWGIRTFPIKPRSNGVHLWEAMATLDGVDGYNQQLVLNPENPEMVFAMKEGDRVMVNNSILPKMIAKETNAPVEEFKGDSNRIINFLKQEVDPRAVLATSCFFGWKNLSTQCNVLYVDGDQTSAESLARSFEECRIPSMVIRGQLSDIAGEIEEEAKKLLFPPDLEGHKRSERRLDLRSNPTPRTSTSVSAFQHGQSISLKGETTKGSVGVFLSPTDEAGECYVLTAGHVLVTSVQSTLDLITPGGIDILSMLLSALSPAQVNEEYIRLLLRRNEESCGTLAWDHIGSTDNGWRSDWALARLNPEWRGVNGSWHQDSELATIVDAAKDETAATSFSGAAGVLDCRDPTAGERCYKEGATTGSTSGTIGQTEACLFRKGTADAADGKKDKSSDIDRCTFHLMHPIEIPNVDKSRWVKICGPGDSGSAVFCADEERNGWVWVGQLTSLMNGDDGLTLGLVVPQSKVLSSINKITGKTWSLSTSTS